MSLPEKPYLVRLKTFRDEHGALTPIEQSRDVPFEIKRVFYVFDVAAGDKRGQHAHIECQQFLIALSGVCEVRCFDGIDYQTFTLDNPEVGLLIPRMVWAEEIYKTTGTVALILADQHYDPKDYIWEKDLYLKKLQELS